MDTSTSPWLATFAILGLIGGVALLVRGFGAYRTAGRISDTSTSTISAIAAGEVRVSGIVEAAELTLVSLLQSAPCVYYRSTIDVQNDRLGEPGDVIEERSVGFRVRDASGDIRIFPRGAHIDAPLRWSDKASAMGDEPPGLQWRLDSAFALAAPDRDAAVADLLTVHDRGTRPVGMPSGRTDRKYKETRLELGDEVTIIGRAVPFSDVHDPANADVGGAEDPFAAGGDPEIAADIERARAAGTLMDDPEDAWGNAAIPGFGIGRPTRAPELDPDAHTLPIATADEAERADRTFTIPPETLVLAAATDGPLLITYGSPVAAAGRERSQFLIGLLGAVLAIASAMALAVLFDGGSFL